MTLREPEIEFLPITDLATMLDAGRVGAVELASRMIARAEDVGAALNCFTHPMAESALAEAAAADRRAKAGRRLGPLDGIPIALKDNIDVAGVPTSNGFGGGPYRIAEEDAEVVRRLRAAGAVILGKTNMQEGALGAASDNAHFGAVINPYRPGYSPGGSSGGSGAAVAAGLCCAALGTDTGGSVRIPAAYCGTVGLKASYGLISTRGVVPLSYSLDHVGPLTRTVADAAVLLSALQGHDAHCPESRDWPCIPLAVPAAGRLDGLRFGVVRTFEQEPAEPDVAAAFHAVLDVLVELGAEIRTVEMPGYDLVAGRRAGFVRVEVEAAFVHGDLYRAEPHRFSPEMAGFIEYGMSVSAQRLMRADRTIALGAFAFDRCFDTVDLLVSPTTPQTAFAFGTTVPESAGTYTIPANFAGAPALSLPMGSDATGLPVGLQVMARSGQDVLALRAAAAYEAAAGWRLAPPPPFGPQTAQERK